jgi:hypothetical protein
MAKKKSEDFIWTDAEARIADLMGMRYWEPKHLREFMSNPGDEKIAGMISAGFLPQPVEVGNRVAVRKRYYKVEDVIRHLHLTVRDAAS